MFAKPDSITVRCCEEESPVLFQPLVFNQQLLELSYWPGTQCSGALPLLMSLTVKDPSGVGPFTVTGPTETASWSPAHVLAFPVKRLAPVAMGDLGMVDWIEHEFREEDIQS